MVPEIRRREIPEVIHRTSPVLHRVEPGEPQLSLDFAEAS